METASSHNGLRIAALTLLVLIACCSLTPEAKAAPQFGFNQSFAVPPPATDGLLNEREVDAGAKIDRLTVSWADVDHDRSTQDWARYDRRIAAIEAAGMKPLIILQGSPSWARTGLACNSRPVFCPPDSAHLANWERFAYQVAERYPNAAAIEVWNEPNWYGTWPTSSGPDPEHYARMFRLAHGAIKFVNPSMRVLVGSLVYSYRGDVPQGNMSIPTWLRGFAFAGGTSVMRPEDGIGIHAYPWVDEMETLDTQFATIMRQIREQRDIWLPGKKIWVTETGVTTTGSHAVSERQQARTITYLLNELLDDSDLGAVLIHTSIEPTPDPRNPAEVGSGLLKWETLRAKLAYCVLVARAGGDWASYPGCPADLVEAVGLSRQQLGIPDSGGGGGPGDCEVKIANLKQRKARLKQKLAAHLPFSKGGHDPNRRVVRRVRAKLKVKRQQLREVRATCEAS